MDDPADAADAVAETFLVAWRRLGEVPDGREARLWLFGVCRRVLANHRRGELRRRHLAGEGREVELRWSPAGDHEELVSDRERDADHRESLTVDGRPAVLLRYAGTDEYTTVWTAKGPTPRSSGGTRRPWPAVNRPWAAAR